MKCPPPRFIFRNKDGEGFAEYTHEEMKNDARLFPKDIRSGLTKCAIEGARGIELEPKRIDLQKYGLLS